MTSRLGLYNRALRHIGERTLASLTEVNEARRALDAAWDDGFVRYCLEQGQWNFAIRSVELSYTPDIGPTFGYRYAFDVPEDFVRAVGVCSDEYFNVPLTQVMKEGSYWYADLDTIYVRYVSDDLEYGSDFSLWPESFAKWAALHLAEEVAGSLTASESKQDRIKKDARTALSDARSKDALDESATFPPTGQWAQARHGRWSRRDRGNRGSLIG